jgi:hypothetical protein
VPGSGYLVRDAGDEPCRRLLAEGFGPKVVEDHALAVHLFLPLQEERARQVLDVDDGRVTAVREAEDTKAGHRIDVCRRRERQYLEAYS